MVASDIQYTVINIYHTSEIFLDMFCKLNVYQNSRPLAPRPPSLFTWNKYLWSRESEITFLL